jgi:polysaccharide export outer membrane protein
MSAKQNRLDIEDEGGYDSMRAKNGCSRCSNWVVEVSAIVLLTVLPCLSQSDYQPSPIPSTPQENLPNDYAIGPGDLLSITIADLPELSGKYLVSETGMVEVPVLPTPIRAAGLTSLELSKNVGHDLEKAQQLRDPVVSVFVEEYRSQVVTVLGAVARPSVYPLRRSTSLLEVLSMAGGLIPQSGNKLTLQHKRPTLGNEEPTSGQEAVLNIDLAKLMQGRDPSLNLEIHGGDVVTVLTAPLVFVVGAVIKQGGYALQNQSEGLTILQALAMAEGLKSIAAPGRGMVIRQSAGGRNRQEIPVDLTRMLEGKEGDILLESSDILFIPESGMKKSLQKMGEIAMQATNGLAIYGLGYRVGGLIP